MTKIKHALPFAALLVALAGSAHAATDIGVLKSFDSARHTVTLSDGTSYVLASSVDVARLPMDEETIVGYSMVGGQRTADSIEPILGRIGPDVNPTDMPFDDQ